MWRKCILQCHNSAVVFLEACFTHDDNDNEQTYIISSQQDTLSGHPGSDGRLLIHSISCDGVDSQKGYNVLFTEIRVYQLQGNSSVKVGNSAVIVS